MHAQNKGAVSGALVYVVDAQVAAINRFDDSVVGCKK